MMRHIIKKSEPDIVLGKPDQDLVMAGYMALAGSAVMARWDEKRLKERLPEELLQDLFGIEKQMEAKKSVLTDAFLQDAGASAWLPMGVGGVYKGLWDMAEQWGTGFTVQLRSLPVRQETIEICELEEKNPYYLWSSGCLLIAADHGDRLCQALKKQGIPAAVIGVLTDKKDKTLIHDSTVSCLNRPKADELDGFMSERGVDLFEVEF